MTLRFDAGQFFAVVEGVALARPLGASAALQLGVREDLSLVMAGLVSGTLLFTRAGSIMRISYQKS